jgi:hypothetical protein
VGVWVLGFGPKAPIPNPQSPIPNPQSPFKYKFIHKKNNKKVINLKLKKLLKYKKK